MVYMRTRTHHGAVGQLKLFDLGASVRTPFSSKEIIIHLRCAALSVGDLKCVRNQYGLVRGARCPAIPTIFTFL